MFEFIAGLVAGYVLTWPALVIVLLAGIFFEHTGSRKMAIAAGIGAMAISYHYFDVSIKALLAWAVVYLVVGVLWSFWRYRGYVAKEMQQLQSIMFKRQADLEWRLHCLAPGNNLDRISAWIIIWPFSLVEHLLGDIINAINALASKVFKGVYFKIYTSLTAGILEKKFPEDK